MTFIQNLSKYYMTQALRSYNQVRSPNAYIHLIYTHSNYTSFTHVYPQNTYALPLTASPSDSRFTHVFDAHNLLMFVLYLHVAAKLKISSFSPQQSSITSWRMFMLSIMRPWNPFSSLRLHLTSCKLSNAIQYPRFSEGRGS